MSLARSGWFAVLVVLMLAATACTENQNGGTAGDGDDPVNVVTTTSMIRDAVENVAGDLVELESLMGAGIDPHNYRARESDVARMEAADVIFYNGHHLEGAMSDVLEQMEARTHTVPIAERIDQERLIAPDLDILGEDFEGQYDPHIWFDVELWALAVEVIREELIELDPDNQADYEANTESYLAELEELDQYVHDRVAELPEEQRILITAHDAFGYLGSAYSLEVHGLQPLSTVVEAGAADVREMADLIVDREIHAIFLETAVPPQGIEAVKEAARSRGFDVQIGGELYGDALGEEGTEEGTYIGAFRHNIDTIVNALLNEGGETAEQDDIDGEEDEVDDADDGS